MAFLSITGMLFVVMSLLTSGIGGYSIIFAAFGILLCAISVYIKKKASLTDKLGTVGITLGAISIVVEIIMMRYGDRITYFLLDNIL